MTSPEVCVPEKPKETSSGKLIQIRMPIHGLDAVFMREMSVHQKGDDASAHARASARVVVEISPLIP